jgi:hypothetical protein
MHLTAKLLIGASVLASPCAYDTVAGEPTAIAAIVSSRCNVGIADCGNQFPEKVQAAASVKGWQIPASPAVHHPFDMNDTP